MMYCKISSRNEKLVLTVGHAHDGMGRMGRDGKGWDGLDHGWG